MGIGASVIGALRIVLGMDVAEFEEGSKRAQSAMEKLNAKANALAQAIGAAFLTSQITRFASHAVEAFGEQEDAIAAVEAAIKSTGGTAGFTTDQLVKMSEQLQRISTYGDEKILTGVTANLLTFGNIVGPVFERAQLAALNLSTRLKQDLQSSAIQLGKALNDPIAGLTALRRVGVAFTEAQKDQIKTLVTSNKVMEAQKVILDELEKEFGGQAEAVAKTTKGALMQAANAFGDAMEVIGSKLAPIIVPAAKAIKSLSEEFQNLDPKLQTFILTMTGVAAVFVTATVAAGAFAAVFGTISVPLVAVGVAIAAVTAAFITWGENIGRILTVALQKAYGFYQGIRNYLYEALKPILNAVGEWFTWLGEQIQWVSEKIGLSEAADRVAVSANRMVASLKPFEEELVTLWNGTNQLAEAGVEMGRAWGSMLPNLKIPKGWDPEASAKKQKELNKQIQDGVSIVKKGEAPWAKYTRQMTDLNAAYKAGKISAAQLSTAQKQLFEEAKVQYEGGAELIAKYQSPYEQMVETVRKLNEQYKEGAISAEALGRSQAQAAMVATSAYVDMASSIGNNLSTVFKKSKAIAIATGTIDAISSALKALSAYPPPFSYVAAAAALAAGMAKVAAIKSTNESGGGGGSGAAAATNPNAGGGAGSASQVLTVRGLSAGSMMSGDSVRELANKLLDYQRDGGRVVLQ